MENFSYAGDFGIYDNPYFIMIFFGIILGFFIFVLIKTDNNAARRQNDGNTNGSIQEQTNVKIEVPVKSENLDKTEKLKKIEITKINEAFEIIKIRYAKGEINEEEFEKIKRAVT